MWVTVAKGTTIDGLNPTVGDFELRKGCPIRFAMDLKLPVAKSFDLFGAELIFRGAMPEGVDLIDVHSEGNYRVVVEAEADPVWLLAAVAFVKVHWVSLLLGAIALTFTLGFLVMTIKMDVPEEFVAGLAGITKWVVIGIAVLAVIIVIYLAWGKEKLKG